MGKRVARIGDRCAAEIQRVAMFIQHHLDDVGIAQRRLIVDRMAGGGDRAFGMVVQMFGDGAYQRRRNQRFVALHIDNDGVIRPARCSTTSAMRSVPLA